VNSKPAFEVEIEPARNVVRIRYFGDVLVAHMQAGAAELERLLPQMRTGFAVLTDLSGLDSMELGCAPHLTRIMDLCKTRGVGLVVRIIPDPAKDIGLNILSLTHYRGQVKIVTCGTLAEAERALG
jgi:hypothetical protein